jgi:Rv0078B-related antitoxin
MTGQQRLLLALEMSDFARELAAQQIRDDHPDWPPDLITRELTRLSFLPAPLPPGF